jgi:desulfoferrodoxin (superoxide reductase-like protein)
MHFIIIHIPIIEKYAKQDQSEVFISVLRYDCHPMKNTKSCPKEWICISVMPIGTLILFVKLILSQMKFQFWNIHKTRLIWSRLTFLVSEIKFLVKTTHFYSLEDFRNNVTTALKGSSGN